MVTPSAASENLVVTTNEKASIKVLMDKVEDCLPNALNVLKEVSRTKSHKLIVVLDNVTISVLSIKNSVNL